MSRNNYHQITIIHVWEYVKSVGISTLFSYNVLGLQNLCCEVLHIKSLDNPNDYKAIHFLGG